MLHRQFSLISDTLGDLHILQCAGLGSHFRTPVRLRVDLESPQVLLPRVRVGKRMLLEADGSVLLVLAGHDDPARTALAEIDLLLADLGGPGPHHGPEEVDGGVSFNSVLQQSLIKSRTRSEIELPCWRGSDSLCSPH